MNQNNDMNTSAIDPNKIIHFNYDREMVDGEEKVFFRLENFPTIKFSYVDVRFGSPDEDNMVPVMFDLDIAHLVGVDECQPTDEFNDEVKGLLVHLLEISNNRAVEIINSPQTEGLTTPSQGVIMPLTGQDK